VIAQPVFDTLAFVKRLSAAGMSTSQAEALAEALTDYALDQLATKADLREFELRLTNNLTTRFGTMLAGSTALTVAILGTLITLM
jgi:hypothetical protein